MIELSDIERKLEKVDKKIEENSLAMEMLSGLKKQSRHKFIIIIILIIALIGTNIGWLIYNSQFETISEEETVTEQHIEDIQTDNSQFSQTIN